MNTTPARPPQYRCGGTPPTLHTITCPTVAAQAPNALRDAAGTLLYSDSIEHGRLMCRWHDAAPVDPGGFIAAFGERP